MKPPVTYYGGKIHLAPMIAAAIPHHVSYLEPFAGSLAVLFATGVWPVIAAAAYSQSRRHDGDIYRWDGWELWSENCGSSGGGLWSRPRSQGDEVYGKKRLWVWRYWKP